MRSSEDKSDSNDFDSLSIESFFADYSFSSDENDTGFFLLISSSLLQKSPSKSLTTD